MQVKPKIIVITGAESTGKTELTKQLGTYFGAPFYPEFARGYIEGLNRKYNYNDIEIIAEKQKGQYLEALNSGAEYVFLDTWLIITKVWFETVYKTCPGWIDPAIKNAEIFAFLLCCPDLPWVPDSVRENGGAKRLKLHQTYKNNIEKLNFNCCEITGLGEKRFLNAVSVLNNL